MTRRPIVWPVGLCLMLALVGMLMALSAPTPPVAASVGSTDNHVTTLAGQAIVDPTLGTNWRPPCWPTADDRLVCEKDALGFQAAASRTDGPFVQVSAGGSHTCGLKTDGTIACWGNNIEGQAPASRTDGPYAGAISAGAQHTCAVKADGTIACWGEQFFSLAAAPTSQTVGPYSRTSHGHQLSAGSNYTCAVKEDLTIACWGGRPTRVLWGMAPDTAPGGRYSQVSAATQYTCGINIDGGKIVCWGYVAHPGLAPGGQPLPSFPGALTTRGDGPYYRVSAGDGVFCGLKNDGALVCWAIDHDTWPNPDSKPVFLPQVELTPTPPGTFAEISVGRNGNTICGVKHPDGALICWPAHRAAPAPPMPPTDTFRTVSVGPTHICGVTTGGSIVCWGDNTHGQLAPPPPPPPPPPPTEPPPAEPPPADPPPADPPPADPPPADPPPADPPTEDPPADSPPADPPAEPPADPPTDDPPTEDPPADPPDDSTDG